ncbi:MAG TPA: carboxypeptidase regulatory-like domain-containing protein [Bryobacteraceae bacterium]|nr:carboxypeptidase regulatory-like domain-containing protein [Bryobacteraceae bacterium]
MWFAALLWAGTHMIDAQNVAIAEVTGTITDVSGALVPHAPVVMTETDKQVAHTTLTDESGHYVFPNLPVGAYSLEVRMTGFKTYVQNNIVLIVGNNIQINATLEVGALSEKVEVQATAEMVETKENSVSAVVDQQRINELPLNGRQATQLILTLGGAAYADAGDTGSKTFYSATRISVAGGQGNGTAYLLDGGDNTDAMSNVNMPFPFPDALQEFSVDTSAVSSRFGTHPGATVNVVTKSGSNAFHGDLFEYIRNGDLNARNFFAPQRDSLKRNQFGGTGGGRVIRDKLFFFAGYQGTRNRSNPPASIAHIPNAAALGGDFSTLTSAGCQSSGKAQTLTNPSTGKPFPRNKIPVSLLNPVAVKIANDYLPVNSADPCGKVIYGIPVTGDEDQVIGRMDWVQSSKHTLFGRYFIDDFQNPPTFDGKNVLTTTAPGNFERAQSATIGDTYTFGPGTVNSFHVTFNRLRDNRGPTDVAINPTMLGVSMYSAVPNFLLMSVTNYFNTYCGTCAPGHFNVTSYQVADDVDLIRGRHELAFGFNLIRIQNNTLSGFDENGAFSFNGSLTGNGLADFLLGLPNDFQQTNATPDDLRQWVMSFYGQDTFRISKNFTLNYGLRWQPTFSDPDKYGRGNSFSLPAFFAGTHSAVHPSAPAGLFFKSDAGIPDAMWNGRKANFAPRVGLVWDPHGDARDTLRVGAAILYDSTETWFNERETTNPPYGNNIDVPTPIGGLSNPWLGFPGGNPFPQNGNLYFPTAGVYVNMPINPQPTSMAQWNITYQRQFAGNWLASISYLGNSTSHIWITHETNPATYMGTAPCVINGKAYTVCSTTGNTNQRRLLYQLNPALGAAYASIDTADDGAVAHYEGLLLSLQHRFGQHFELLTNYTNSYCISDYDFGAALATPANSQPFNRHADWGPCISDTRHIFNISLVAQSSFGGGNAFLRALLSNWQLAPLFHASSGQPLTVTTGKDNSLTGLNNDRPDQVMSDVYSSTETCKSAPCVQWISPAAFVPNPVGTFGNAGRNSVRGPKTVNLDMALSRIFKFGERWRLQARGEAFNILNHTNFVGGISPAGLVSAYSTMNTNLSSSSFGQVQSAFDPRILQFALKLYF